MSLAIICPLVNVFKLTYNLFLIIIISCRLGAKNVHRDVVICNELGLHARSAAQIAKIVQNAKANIWIKRGKEKVDASSIMDILTLASAKGTTITIIIEDPSDIDVLDAVVELVSSGFGE